MLLNATEFYTLLPVVVTLSSLAPFIRKWVTLWSASYSSYQSVYPVYTLQSDSSAQIKCNTKGIIILKNHKQAKNRKLKQYSTVATFIFALTLFKYYNLYHTTTFILTNDVNINYAILVLGLMLLIVLSIYTFRLMLYKMHDLKFMGSLANRSFYIINLKI